MMKKKTNAEELNNITHLSEQNFSDLDYVSFYCDDISFDGKDAREGLDRVITVATRQQLLGYINKTNIVQSDLN